MRTIVDMFGFGKKEKAPFTIPGEVSALRNRIEVESRENYPNLRSYQEIANNAKVVYAQLDAIIAQTDYAGEAIRIKEDIKNKIARLSDKINNNRKEALKEGGRGYVASNMAYLERKGMRNQAKTLYTEFLVAIESIMKCYNEEPSRNSTTIEPAIEALMKIVAELNKNFFNKYGEDNEIKKIREELHQKIEGLNHFFEENMARLKERGLEENARSILAKIARAAGKPSEK